MAISKREATVFIGGLAIGLAGWGLYSVLGKDGGQAPAAKSQPASQVAAKPVAPVLAAVSCSFDPIIGSAGSGDGQLTLARQPQADSAKEVRDLIVTGKEAAASGQRRDAEIAFLNACRAAEQLPAGEGTPLADAQYQLAWHYAAVLATGAGGRQDEIRRRAQALYGSSLQAYEQKYGDSHEKSRFARQGLEAMGGPGETMVAAAPARVEPAKPAPAKPAAPVVVAPKPPAPAVVAVAPAPAPAPAPVAPAKPVAAAQGAATSPQPAPRVAAPAPAPAVAPQPAVAAANPRVRPSFDCALARSTTEKIICADEDLARQDRELGRLHARAKQRADDPRDFQRRSDAAWSRREATCTDRDCLQRWYAQRRDELRTAEAPAARPPAVSTARAQVEAPAPRPRPAVVAPPVVAPAEGVAVAPRAPVERRPAPAPRPAPRPAPAEIVDEPAQATGSVGDVSQ